MALRIQRPTEGYDWLYQDRGENDRYFTTIVLLGNAEPAWAECLDIEKVTWNMDFSKDIDLSDWNPTDKGTTFLQNFRDHIALRLTSNGSGLTLTLSHDVFEAIGFLDGTIPSSDIRYEIRTIIGNKGWKVKCAADSDQYPT